MSAEQASSCIARLVEHMRVVDMGSDVFRSVGRAIVDTCAVGVAGIKEPAALRVLSYLRQSGRVGSETAMSASLWGVGTTGSVEEAALFNGVAAHVLDFDDVTSPLRGHPSVAMLPALIALGEARAVSGDVLARAYIAGFEVMVRLAKSMTIPHYTRGWHSTATIGVMGATAACALLEGLDPVQTAAAMGLAVAQASGTRANFGYDAKSFQAGITNASAVRAVLLAKEGFSASPVALDSPIGFAALYGNGESLADTFKLQKQLEVMSSGIEVKKYPLCYATHRALDGMLDLRKEHSISLRDVRSVVVETSRGALDPLVHHSPKTGLEAKFSMEYAITAALCDGKISIASFQDAAVLRPEIQAFFPNVTARASSEGDVLPRWTRLTINLQDGRSLVKTVKDLRGSAQLPLSDAELVEKAQDCFAWAGVDASATVFGELAFDLARNRVRDLMGALG